MPFEPKYKKSGLSKFSNGRVHQRPPHGYPGFPEAFSQFYGQWIVLVLLIGALIQYPGKIPFPLNKAFLGTALFFQLLILVQQGRIPLSVKGPEVSSRLSALLHG